MSIGYRPISQSKKGPNLKKIATELTPSDSTPNSYWSQHNKNLEKFKYGKYLKTPKL